MRLFKLSAAGENDTLKFVNFWADLYYDKLEELYIESINKNYFGREDILKLYKWKNRGNLSMLKQNSLNTKILDKLTMINQLKSNFSLSSFKNEFRNVSAIWKIFLLHIIIPQKYPMFDQHVYRAYYFLKNQQIEELPFSNTAKEELYFNKYIPFFNTLLRENVPCKRLDEALWILGKFLKTNYVKLIY